LTDARGFVVQASVAPGLPVPVVIASVTCEESFATVRPPASSTVTTGCVGKAALSVELAGWVVKASCVAGPKMTSPEAGFAARVSVFVATERVVLA
jgi:hypothetical protein